MPADRRLVERAQNGDRTAFSEIVAASTGWLTAIARLTVRDPERAKDAIQEALIQAWRDLPSLRDPDRFEAWMRQLLVRSCVDELRRAGRRQEVHFVDATALLGSDSTHPVGERDAIERGFERLDAEQRALVVLRYYHGLSVEEAADALRVPVGTAKSRLFRARETLRAALEADARVTSAREGRV